MMTKDNILLRAKSIQECQNSVCQLEKRLTKINDTLIWIDDVDGAVEKALMLIDDICLIESIICRDRFHWDYDEVLKSGWSWGSESERKARIQKRDCRLTLARYYYDLIQEQLGIASRR